MKLLQQLIQISSVSGEEQKIQEFIFAFLVKQGINPFYVGKNVVAKIPGINKKSALIFDCHVDTVPAGDLNLWKYKPLWGEIVNGKIYGLGASDEKAAVATTLLLAEKLAISKPECDVWLTFVVNEEIDGSGTEEFVSWFSKKEQKKYQQIAAVLGEPTDLKKLKLAHKGNIFLKVTTHGDGGHGSKPEKIKKHAVLEMYEVVQKIEKLGKIWGKNYKDGLLGSPTIGLATSISAGSLSSPNKFPDSCTATFDIRTTPKLHDLVLGQIKKLLAETKVDLVYPAVSYGYTDKKEKIAQIAQKISGAKFDVSSGSTDLCFFTAVKIPGIIFGPGSEDCCHSPNEYCQVSNIAKCLKIYLKVIDKFGGGE